MSSWKSAIVTWEKRNGLTRIKPTEVIEVEDNEPGIDLWSD